jgi:hypothetical protein
VVHLGLFSLLGNTMLADGATDCGANNSMVVSTKVTGNPAYGRSCQTTRLGSGGRTQSSADRENYQMPLHGLAPKDGLAAVGNHFARPSVPRAFEDAMPKWR